MPAFLFLQKFVAGAPATMPLDDVADLLVEAGPILQEGDVYAVRLPPDRYAAHCTLIGNAESGVSCIGFEGPLHSEELRRLVWKCMRRFGSAAFSDCLERVYVRIGTQAGLPEAIQKACPLAVRRISSAQQLWPDSLSFSLPGPERPALIYRRPGESEGRFQLFDRLGSGNRELYCDLTLHPDACTPGTLAVIKAMMARIADAIVHSDERYSLFYNFRHNEASLQVMEAGPPLPGNRKVFFVKSGEQLLRADLCPIAPSFFADREIFASTLLQASDLTRHMAARGITLDATLATITDLDRLLDEQHQLDADKRRNLEAGSLFENTEATRWAVGAGCYLGVLVSRHIGGQFGYITLANERLPVVRTHCGGLIQPHLQVLDHIINGRESSVAAWFEQVAKANVSATKREDDLACNIPGFCQILLGKARFAGEGGLPLEEEIPRQQLDFSVESLRHLDLYLGKVAAKVEHLGYESLSNLELAAGAYLGEVVRSNTRDKSTWVWVNYADHAHTNPGFSDKRPWHRSMRVFLDSAQNTTYPLAQISLCLTDPSALGAQEFARKLLGNATSPEEPAPPSDAVTASAVTGPAPENPKPFPQEAQTLFSAPQITPEARALLNAFHTDDPSVEFVFRKALGQANLDYTPESLGRIDRLLRQMHTQLKPQFQAFAAVQANANFVQLLGYYIGTVIAGYTFQIIEWFKPDDLEPAHPASDAEKIGPDFQYAIFCIFYRDGNPVDDFHPFEIIHDILFKGDPSRSVADSAEKFLRRAVSLPLLQAPLNDKPVSALTADQPGDLGKALERLGLMMGIEAAQSCRTALQEGLPIELRLVHDYPDGILQINTLAHYARNEAVNFARYRFNNPVVGTVGTVFAHEGFINLPRFRTNALILEAQWHEPGLRLVIAVPYRHKYKPDGFVLHTPRVLESTLPQGGLPILEAAFFKGINAGIEEHPPGLWAERYLDENDPKNLADRAAEQAAAIYAEEPDPFATIRFDGINVAACIAALPPDELEYTKVIMPPWAEEAGFAELFDDLPLLLREGRVVWGQTVRANKALFEPGFDDGLPGDVLYDPAGALTPTDLSPIARELYASRNDVEALRKANPPQPERLRIAEHFQGESTPARALRVPHDAGYGELIMTSVYFVRRHLPTETLLLPYFPLLILDSRPGSAMVLPSRWWPERLLKIWPRFEKEQTLKRWHDEWAKLATEPEDDKATRERVAMVESLQNYVQHGVSDKEIRPFMSRVDADGSRDDFYRREFTRHTEPAPREWEWGLDSTLNSLAERYTRDIERKRARGGPLDTRVACLAYAMRQTSTMIALHVRLLSRRRGPRTDADMPLWADEILWVALGFVSGCEQSALHTARILCAAWRYPEIFSRHIRPEVRAIFILFSRQLGAAIPELIKPFRLLPALDALIEADQWLDPNPAVLAPLVEAACVEHTEEAPKGPFLGLPIAIVLLFKMRAMRGLANPTVTHSLLAPPLGDWAPSVEFDDCLDPMMRAVRERLRTHGFDEGAIAAAILDGTPLDAPPQFARPALPPHNVPPSPSVAPITQLDVQTWKLAATDEFKKQLDESATQQKLLQAGCPPDIADQIISHVSAKVIWGRRVEGFFALIAGIIMFYLTRALVISDASARSIWLIGLLGVILTAFGIFRVRTRKKPHH